MPKVKDSSVTTLARTSNGDSALELVLPAAILWDMDGTLIDSEPFWQAAEMELVTSGGGVWSLDQALGKRPSCRCARLDRRWSAHGR